MPTPNVNMEPSEMTPSSVSPLLDLPPELRNWIFELALTADEPLACVMDSGDSSMKLISSQEDEIDQDQVIAAVPFNQLKFVNRQVHNETKGIELRLNTIRFPVIKTEEGDYLDPVQRLVGFLGKLSSNRVSWLNKVILKSKEPALEVLTPCLDRPEELSRIVEICKLHPHIEVRYTFNEFEPHKYGNLPSHPDRFFLIGAILSIALQNNPNIVDELFPGSGQKDDLCRLADWWLCEMPGGIHGVRNLAIFPASEPGEDEFVPEVFHNFVPERPNSSFSKQQQETWRKWTVTWRKDGIKPTI